MWAWSAYPRAAASSTRATAASGQGPGQPPHPGQAQPVTRRAPGAGTHQPLQTALRDPQPGPGPGHAGGFRQSRQGFLQTGLQGAAGRDQGQRRRGIFHRPQGSQQFRLGQTGARQQAVAGEGLSGQAIHQVGLIRQGRDEPQGLTARRPAQDQVAAAIRQYRGAGIALGAETPGLQHQGDSGQGQTPGPGGRPLCVARQGRASRQKSPLSFFGNPD